MTNFLGGLSLFEVEVSRIEPFRNLMRALAAVVDEGCFNVDESRIWLLAMDSSRVALVDFELPGEFFDEYRCDGESRISSSKSISSSARARRLRADSTS